MLSVRCRFWQVETVLVIDPFVTERQPSIDYEWIDCELFQESHVSHVPHANPSADGSRDVSCLETSVSGLQATISNVGDRAREDSPASAVIPQAIVMQKQLWFGRLDDERVNIVLQVIVTLLQSLNTFPGLN